MKLSNMFQLQQTLNLHTLNGEILSPGWGGLGIGFAIMLGTHIIWAIWKDVLEYKEKV